MKTLTTFQIAEPLGLAACVELRGDAPEWVELLPAGPVIRGRDGRAWAMGDPGAVIQATQADGMDLPIDYEHATEIRAPQGEPAPAAAWIDASSLRVSNSGAIEGRVSWTERGRAAVCAREYRYLSPVFIFSKATGAIVRLTSAALTNQPNLNIKALNRQQEDLPMAIPAAIREALGLPETATEVEVVSAINQNRQDLASARNSQQPSLDKYVPRQDYDTVLARASNAEQQLAERQQAEQDAEIQRELDSALAAGKITPATLEYHKAQCRTEGGLARFRGFVSAAPSLTEALDLDKRPPAALGVLTEEEKAVCRLLGQSEDEFIKAKGVH